MKLLLLILITYGLTNIIVNGEIFYSIRCWIATKSRKLYELITCMTCAGFWCGLFIAILYGYGIESFFYACLLSGTNTIIETILNKK